MTSLSSFNRFVFTTLFISLTLALVGCGGDDSEDKSGTPSGEGGQAGAADE